MSWRCKNERQRKDKAEIYNSREWKELRARKLTVDPLCEECKKEGYITSAHAVHHRHPIEDSSSKEEMRRWAFDWNNLVSVCDACHARIHKEEGKGTRKLAIERARQRQERWADSLKHRFTASADTSENS